MSKICVIISCYNKHHILNNIYNFLINIFDKENFYIYIVNNDIINHLNIKNIYDGNFIVVGGLSTVYLKPYKSV